MRKRFIENDTDLTFIFTPRGTGYKITVIDNNFESEIKLDDLDSNAERFYIKCLIEMTKNKMKQPQTA